MNNEEVQKGRHRPSDHPVDKLESDPLPPSLEEAEAEYFADMAFDDRLEVLLKNESPTYLAHFSHQTTAHQDGFVTSYFKTNSAVPHEFVFDDAIEIIEEDAFSYTLTGLLQRLPRRLDVDMTITPEDDSSDRITVHSDKDNPHLFYLSKENRSHDADLDIIDERGLFTLLCQLGGANKQSVDTAMDGLAALKQDKPSLMRAHIEDVWQRLADEHGTKETIYELIHEVKQPVDENHPEKIKLFRKETETKDKTLIELLLEHATESPEFDIEESYCLKLVFEHTSEKNVEKTAEKVIVSGISPKLIGLSASRKSRGRITKLDIDTITIKELFVNWFDEIVAA